MSEIKGQHGSFFLRPLSLAYRWPPSPRVFTWFPSVFVLISSSSYKDIINAGLGPSTRTLFYLNHLFKKLHLQIQLHSELLGLGCQSTNLGGI